MSEQLAQLEKKGGLQETRIWTNTNPTGDFGTQTITLLDSVGNYKAIRLYYRASNTDSTEYYIDYPSSLVIASTSSASVPILYFGKHATSSATTRYVRYIEYQSSTRLKFSVGVLFDASGGNSPDVCIPTKICGLK